MSLRQVAGARLAMLTRTVRLWAKEWNRVGEQMVFYAETLRRTQYAITRYKLETMRLVAQMSLGIGALAAIGGTVTIVTVLVISAGGVVGVEGHFILGEVGLDAMGGFFSSYVNTRITAPFIAAVGLCATVGAGTTAQLGAMRINEEIDALEVMGIHPVTYLASTRVVAGLTVVVPIFFLALVAAYGVTWAIMVGLYAQSGGAYQHYFNTFLDPRDVLWAAVEVVVAAISIMLIHTYYGLTASGGPAGVGEATGRAVRASLIAASFVAMIATLVLYGRSGHFHMSA